MQHDEDQSDPRQYCKHGTFIGSWWGPDYMCGWCEDGTSDEDWIAGLAAARRHRIYNSPQAMFYRVYEDILVDRPFDAAIATALTEAVLRFLADDPVNVARLQEYFAAEFQMTLDRA